jgi:hypothetical protein
MMGRHRSYRKTSVQSLGGYSGIATNYDMGAGVGRAKKERHSPDVQYRPHAVCAGAPSFALEPAVAVAGAQPINRRISL